MKIIFFCKFLKSHKVCHPDLLNKFKNSGIHGNLLKRIESYLTNRTQKVQLRNFFSKAIPVPSLVSQGSSCLNTPPNMGFLKNSK